MLSNMIVLTIVFLVLLVVLIVIYNAYYQKAGRGIVLVRTGFGGQQVVIDGGCLSLPFLHSTERITTSGIAITVRCEESQALMTADLIPVDLAMEFELRVELTESSIQLAARSVGGTNLNNDDLIAMYKGRFVDAMQAEVSRKTMADLHAGRESLGGDIKIRLAEGFHSMGLLLESASLLHLDQTSVSTLNEENILHAQGMRVIAEQVSENRKRRAEIEASAEVVIHATVLAQTKARVDYERQKKEAEIGLEESVNKIQAESESRSIEVAEHAAQKNEEAKLMREKSVREAELTRDLALRQNEISNLREAEFAKIDSQIALHRKRMEEVNAEAALEESRTEIVRAQEKIHFERENLVAERKKHQSLIRAREEQEVKVIETDSGIRNRLLLAESEVKAVKSEAEAEVTKMQAEAEGRRAIIAAENALDERIIRMKLEQQKIEILPEIVKTVSKPLEKIEGIRINHIGGSGWPSNPSTGSSGDASPFADVMQNILSMSLQLPVIKKIGEEIGLDVDANVATRAADAITRARQVEVRESRSNRDDSKSSTDMSDSAGNEDVGSKSATDHPQE